MVLHQCLFIGNAQSPALTVVAAAEVEAEDEEGTEVVVEVEVGEVET